MDNKNIHARQHRHAEPLALAGRHLGDAGGQACLCRKAGQPQCQRRPALVEVARRHQQDLPGRHANPQPDRAPSRPSSSSESGKLGQLKVARGLCYKPRASHRPGTTANAPIPKSVDYNLWCGPAPRRPLNRAAPPLRLALALGLRQRRPRQPGHPSDGRRPLGPGQELSCPAPWSASAAVSATPTTAKPPTRRLAVFDYGNAELIFEVRGLRTKDYRGTSIGNVFHCTDGYLVFTSYSTAIAYDLKGAELRRFTGGGDHYGNFVAAVRSGRRAGPQGRHQRRPSVERPVPPGQHQLSPGPADAVQRPEHRGSLRRRPRRQRNLPPHARTPDGQQGALDKTSYHGRADGSPSTSRRRRSSMTTKPIGMLTREYRKGFEVPARVG